LFLLIIGVWWSNLLRLLNLRKINRREQTRR